MSKIDVYFWRLFQLYCILIPFGIYFLQNVTFILTGVLAVFGYLYLREHRINLFQTKLFSWLCGFMGFSMISIVWSEKIGYAVSTNYSILQRVVFAFFAYMLVRTEERINRIMTCLLIGVISILVSLFLFYGLGGVHAFLNGSQQGRFGEDLTNVNTIGFYLSIAGVIVWHRYLYGQKKIFYLCCLAVCFLGIIATGGRGNLIALILGILCCSYLKTKGTRIIRLIVIIACLGLAFHVIRIYNLFPQAMQRIDSASDMSIGEKQIGGSIRSRLEFARFGVKKIIQSPLWGYGAGQFRYYLGKTYGIELSSHNNYIEILFSYGIIGFFLWYGMFLYTIFRLKECKINSTKLLLSLLCMRLVLDCSGHSLGSIFTYLLLGISFTLFETQSKAESKRNNEVWEGILSDNGA